MFIAHRANNNHNYLENTKEAVINCLKQNYIDGIEIYIRVTNDKEFVLIHNILIDNVSNSSGFVKEYPDGIVTGFIHASGGDTIRIGGIQWCNDHTVHNYVCAYKSDCTLIGTVYGQDNGYNGTKISESCTIDYGTPLTTIKLVDKETKETIKELPPEKTLDMICKVWELAGMLVDEKR